MKLKVLSSIKKAPGAGESRACSSVCESRIKSLMFSSTARRQKPYTRVSPPLFRFFFKRIKSDEGRSDGSRQNGMNELNREKFTFKTSKGRRSEHRRPFIAAAFLSSFFSLNSLGDLFRKIILAFRRARPRFAALSLFRPRLSLDIFHNFLTA